MSELVESFGPRGGEAPQVTWRGVAIIGGIAAAKLEFLPFMANDRPEVLGPEDTVEVNPMPDEVNISYVDYTFVTPHADAIAIAKKVALDTVGLISELAPGERPEILEVAVGNITDLEDTARYEYNRLENYTDEVVELADMLTAANVSLSDITPEFFTKD